MRYGDSGENVRLVQEALFRLGYHGIGNADGNFGLRTDAAVRYFQASNNLQIDGEVDAATAHALGVDLTAHQAGGRPHLRIGDFGRINELVNYTVENSGANGHGHDYIKFEGPENRSSHLDRNWEQGSGNMHYSVEVPSTPGHYRVSLAVNVTDANPAGDDHRELDFTV